jgi:hypothetical protein
MGRPGRRVGNLLVRAARTAVVDGADAVAVAARGATHSGQRCYTPGASEPRAWHEETASMGRAIQFPDVVGAVASTRTPAAMTPRGDADSKGCLACLAGRNHRAIRLRGRHLRTGAAPDGVKVVDDVDAVLAR